MLCSIAAQPFFVPLRTNGLYAYIPAEETLPFIVVRSDIGIGQGERASWREAPAHELKAAVRQMLLVDMASSCEYRGQCTGLAPRRQWGLIDDRWRPMGFVNLIGQGWVVLGCYEQRRIWKGGGQVRERRRRRTQIEVDNILKNNSKEPSYMNHRLSTENQDDEQLQRGW
ncbi:LOW QUALITY PROTEIN: hypothetical protein CVT26_007324 [Gymnopilus dilepis]|uniref:Uncharacterized protein n=1 Tax=Gymnopilus dilepis TaxID=231916 RepID=A0A409W1G1_9AGAR|nr:LOW QUALITY PROTEIN: hypothetical protein CVT26_007324 [Gymnopilus dilepis]